MSTPIHTPRWRGTRRLPRRRPTPRKSATVATRDERAPVPARLPDPPARHLRAASTLANPPPPPPPRQPPLKAVSRSR